MHAETLPPVIGVGDGDIISLLVRNSTQRQVGNNRSEVQEDMAPFLFSKGFRARLYDEQGTSGRDLSKRTVTQHMLEHIKAGHSRGIAVLDIKRLTRDEFGIDGGTIAKVLVDNDAILVTLGKTYDLRDEDDLLQFQFQCMLAGIDIRSIRNTFWQGIFKRLEKGPMFNRPPLGYMTEYVPGPVAGQLLKRPAKDPALAKLMDGMAEAFEECRTLGQVARRLGELGFARPPVMFKGRVVTHWTVQALRHVVNEDIYTGVWEFGGPTRKDGSKRSNVWHKFGRDASGKHKVFRHEVPEFEYWTPADARRWRRKFATSHDGPVIRERRHPHPLLGALICVGCGSPMIGSGKDGYVCRHHRTTACARPQKLAQHIVCGLLRTVLADALAPAADLAARAERGLASAARSEKALRLDHLRERSARLAKVVANMDNPNEDLERELDDMQGQINRLRDEVADEVAEREASAELRASLERIRKSPIALFETLAPDQQARVYALLFKNVRIGYAGRAGARRWWLESFESRFADGTITVLHPHVARVLPWALSGKLGEPSLRIDPPEIENGRVSSVSVRSDIGSSAYLSSLRELSAALSTAA